MTALKKIFKVLTEHAPDGNDLDPEDLSTMNLLAFRHITSKYKVTS